jgi:hypothetical protein
VGQAVAEAVQDVVGKTVGLAVRAGDAPALPAASTPPGPAPGSAIDTRLGEGAARDLLAWYDATPRADVLAVLLGEVERELMIRMVRQAAGATGRSA